MSPCEIKKNRGVFFSKFLLNATHLILCLLCFLLGHFVQCLPQLVNLRSIGIPHGDDLAGPGLLHRTDLLLQVGDADLLLTHALDVRGQTVVQVLELNLERESKRYILYVWQDINCNNYESQIRNNMLISKIGQQKIV